jgi:hypothetical protein
MDEKAKQIVRAVYELTNHSSTDVVPVTAGKIADYSGLTEEDIESRLLGLLGLLKPTYRDPNSYSLTETGLSEGRQLEEREYREKQDGRLWRRTLAAAVIGAIVGALLSGVPAWIQLWLIHGAGFAN